MVPDAKHLLFVLAFLVAAVAADNFLILHPFYSGSHVLTLHHVTENLIARGHKVTTVRWADPHGLKLKPMGARHKEIILYLDNSNGTIPFTTKGSDGIFHMPLENIWDRGLELFTVFRLEGNPWDVCKAYCEQLLGNNVLRKTLSNSNFDLAIVDLIYNECGLALAWDLRLPVIGYWAFSFSSGEAEMTTVATPPSHIPAFISRLSHNMGFFDRVYNFGLKIFSRGFMWYHCWFCDSVVSRFVRGCPSTRDLLGNLNGALLNTNNILDYPRLQPETFINIGGVQISKNPGQLPKDIQEFIDGAEHGVILFTMGFIFNPKVVPKDRVDTLLAAFGRLPQRVIVKFDTPPENSPPNVLVKPFVPQQDILAHPKTILFFTHCGMHGAMEAIWHKVPMVGMPVFIDQGDVLVRMEEKGIAIGIGKWASEDEIYDAIVKVRDDKTFQENINALSELFRMQRNHPMDDTIWLLEYMSKTNGGKHLLLSSRHLNLIQYHSLDVIFFVLVAAFAISKFLRYLINSLLFKPKRQQHRDRPTTTSRNHQQWKKNKRE